MQGSFRSKVYRFPKPVNFSAAQVDSSLDPVWARLDAMIAEIAAANEELDRDILTLAYEDFLGHSVAGDNLTDLPWGAEITRHLFRVWADGRLVFEENVDAIGFMRLPSGFLAREWQFELTTYSHVKRVALGTSVRAVTAGR